MFGTRRETHDRGMSTAPATSQVSVGAVLIAGLGAQLADDAAFLLLPPTALLGPFSGIIAILLTAGAARIVTRNAAGATVARTGLAVGAVSAGVGLLMSGLGFVAILLAGLTVVAGVAGAVAGRGIGKEISG
jgi:hypothetical protein